MVTASRILAGRSAAVGGRDHSSHRLVAIGLSERGAVAVLWALATIGGIGAWVAETLDDSWSILVVVALLLAAAIFAVYLAHVRVYDEAKFGNMPSQGPITPLVMTFMYKRRVAEVVLDFCLVSITYYAAYRLKFEEEQFTANFPVFLKSFPIVVAAQMVAFFVVGTYRGVWRNFGLIDSVVIGKGVALGVVASQLIILYLYRFESYSRVVFAFYAVLLMLIVTASRASFRLIGEFASRRREGGKRLVIYGAGAAGAIAVRELIGSQRFDYQMLGFIDDDPKKKHDKVQGYPVVGSYERLQKMIRSESLDCVVMSFRDIQPKRLGELESLCRLHGVQLSRLLFELDEVVSGRGPRLASPVDRAAGHTRG